MTEAWLPILGHETVAEVSDHGRVRTLDRVVIRSNGLPYTVRGKLKELTDHPEGYKVVSLPGVNYGLLVHVVVLSAFRGPCPAGLEGCHDNGQPDDNRLENLRWDTRKSNILDSVRHGTHWRSSHPQASCKRGHEFSDANTRINSRGARVCRSCERDRSKSPKS